MLAAKDPLSTRTGNIGDRRHKSPNQRPAYGCLSQLNAGRGTNQTGTFFASELSLTN